MIRYIHLSLTSDQSVIIARNVNPVNCNG